MVKFGYTILYVEDVERALRFYESAFGLTIKFMTEEKDYGELETGGTTLAFANYSVAKFNGVNLQKLEGVDPFSFEIVLVANQIDEVFAKAIEGGGVSVATPSQKPWGQTVGYLKDINGYLIELCTPMAN